MLGFGNKATELFSMINPIEHSKSKLAVMKYKVEPYVIPGDVYGQNNLAGRGGWTWYTGSSSWMYIAGIEYILGIKIKDGYLTINPVIPDDWKEFSVQYKCGETVYNIKYEKNNLKDKKVFVNNEEVLDGKIKISSDGKIYNVLVQN